MVHTRYTTAEVPLHKQMCTNAVTSVAPSYVSHRLAVPWSDISPHTAVGDTIKEEMSSESSLGDCFIVSSIRSRQKSDQAGQPLW